MKGETWVYNLSSRATPLGVSQPAPGGFPVEIGHFGFAFDDSGAYQGGLVVDTDTMTLLGVGPEEWLQDARNYPPQLGLDADGIRTLLSTAATMVASAAEPGAAHGLAPAGSHETAATTLSLPGETVVHDLSAAFLQDSPAESLSFGHGNPPLPPVVDAFLHALHIAIA